MTTAPDMNRDNWDGWAPDAAKGSPHTLQERHSPTAREKLRGSNAMQTRRLTDARLWGQMSLAQQEAALQIAAVASMLARGLGYTQSDWEKIPGARGTHNGAESAEKLALFYSDWARRCKAEGISHALILDILLHGVTCAAIDRDRFARRGWARRNLMKGLGLYCRMKGWPEN